MEHQDKSSESEMFLVERCEDHQEVGMGVVLAHCPSERVSPRELILVQTRSPENCCPSYDATLGLIWYGESTSPEISTLPVVSKS